MADEENGGLSNKQNTISINSKNFRNGVSDSRKDVQVEFSPPDGGSRAWLVMLGSFFCNGILFGIINSYSVLYTELYDSLKRDNVSDASSKAALVGSLTMGTTFIVSPVAGVLTDSIGIRCTTFLGGAIAAMGMFLSSFFTQRIEALYFTYGIMYGFGGALAYTPSLAILGHYFKKYMGIANGIVTAGSSCFTMTMPYVIDFFLKTCGLNWMLRVLASIVGCIMLCALLFKPVAHKKKKKAVPLLEAFNISIWKNKRYVIWATVIPLSLFGYFVPYVHMMKFVEDNFSDENDGKVPIMCIGITSGIGRLLFGYIADKPQVNRIMLQQLAFFVIGVTTMLLTTTGSSFPWLVVMALVMGLFDGCFISLLGPIAFDLCGPEGASQAIGFLLGLCSFPLTIGPFAAGLFYDSYKSYDLAFKLAGIPPIFGALALFLIRFVKTEKVKQEISNRMDEKGDKSEGEVLLEEELRSCGDFKLIEMEPINN